LIAARVDLIWPTTRRAAGFARRPRGKPFVDREIGSADFRDRAPWSGEDVKIMAVRRKEAVSITIARAMIGRHLPRMQDYMAAKQDLAERATELASRYFSPVAAGERRRRSVARRLLDRDAHPAESRMTARSAAQPRRRLITPTGR
jgi:hypothetical protein